MRISGQISKVKRRNFDSIRFSVQSSFRDPMSGKPRTKIIASFPSVRSNIINNPTVQKIFWRNVNETLEKLESEGCYYSNDLESVRERFSEVIPIPAATLAATKVVSVSPTGTLADLKERYPVLN